MKHQLSNPYKGDDGYTWMVYCQRCGLESKVTTEFGNEECNGEKSIDNGGLVWNNETGAYKEAIDKSSEQT